MSILSNNMPDQNKESTLRKLLREATHHHHVKLNQHSLLAGLMQPHYPLNHYQSLLCIYYQLYRLLEERIRAFLKSHPDSFEYDDRYKVPWLIKDLAYFKIDPLILTPLSQSATNFLMIETFGQLVGVLYVVEGSSLGGQMIAQILAKNHGFSQDSGSCFFTGYGENTQTFWQGFITFADTLTGDKCQCQLAIEAASQTFQLFNQVLDATTPKNHRLVL